MQKYLTIKNDFTSRQIRVDLSRPVTARKVAGWRQKLHNPGCTSGDELGGRGPQDDPDAYEMLLLRAQEAVATGKTT